MEHEDVINRLKGLGRGSAPAAPDFSQATEPVPVAAAGRFARRGGIAPVAAAVGVIALAAAAFAVPRAMPTQQVAASDTSAEASADVDADADAGAGAGKSEEQVISDKCAAIAASAEGQAEAELAAEGQKTPEAFARKRAAIAEWYSVNCDDAQKVEGAEDEADDDEADDDGDEKGERAGSESANRPEGCTGPPPHSNKPGTGDPERDAAQRDAEKRAWHEWHKENCTSSGSNSQKPAEADEDEADDDRNGHQKARGQGHGEGDARHRDKSEDPGRSERDSRPGADDEGSGSDDD